MDNIISNLNSGSTFYIVLVLCHVMYVDQSVLCLAVFSVLHTPGGISVRLVAKSTCHVTRHVTVLCLAVF